ncbi:MAG: U32 family peptidase, partial [Verrucomicrobia bacterium]|nr:U32 family peptidase [Verrucomicrobiota bacterium]
MTTAPHKPELLAPAGTIQAGLTAIDAGADAIYAGLPKFNARERGQNCTMEELAKLVAYAHRHGRKLYVTLNTLIKESEIPDVAAMLAELLTIRPDAVIVQDLGVLYLIQNHFPELTAHASTQMGIHNSAGVRVAEAMGIKRVILERQVTYEEIGAIRSQTDMELEVFVHGALCCGRSGSCLFSSWMGGWSGNRGRCKQPCRRRYYAEEGNGFFFSPKDLYALEDIPRLAKMGISSLKIEGRMRRADYVHNVVSAYRMMLDAPPETRSKVLPEAKRILAQAMGRKWTPPFRAESDFKDTIQHQAMGTSGRIIGSVVQSKAKGFTAKLSGPLYMHDTIRIQPPSGDEGPAISVTRMTVNNAEAHKVSSGQTCWIACDKPVTTGSRIFKTGSQTADLHKRIEKLPIPGIALDLAVEITQSRIEVTLPATGQHWSLAIETQPARQHALDEATVQSEFARTRSDAFIAGHVRCQIEPGLFVPPSQLKKLRREFWDWCVENTAPDEIRTAYATRLTEVALEALTAHPPLEPGSEEAVVVVKGSAGSPIPGAIAAHPIDHISEHTQEAVMPEFCAEADLPERMAQVEAAVQAGVKRFRVTSLYALDLLRSVEGAYLTASYPLPICNRAAFLALQQFNVERATVWVELGETGINTLLSQLGRAGEVLTYARLPMLSTRMDIPVTGPIQDARGAKFTVEQGRDTTLL